MALTRTSKKSIEITTRELLEASEQNMPPIDPQEVARLLNLKVEFFPFSDEISGLLKKEMGVIGVNENQHPRRQRFTLAHEIGHYVLGHNLISEKDFVDDTSTDSSSRIEREANYFASTLLMPSDLVKKAAKENFDVKGLAKKFEVSEQAMTIRILELGLI